MHNEIKIFQASARLLALVLLVFFLVGCAPFLVQKPERTGEPTEGPLRIHVHTEHHTYRARERVGQTVHRDSTGERVGTSEVYQDVVREGQDTTYELQRSEILVDEADFYAFAGHNAVVDDIEATRDRAVTINRISTGAAIVGASAMIGSYFLLSGDESSLGSGAMVGGLLFSLGGYYGASISAVLLDPTYRHTSNEQAEQAATNYNAEQGYDEPGMAHTESVR